MKQTNNLASDYVSELPNLNLHKQHVLVRVDLNVTRNQDGAIRNDFKLKAILPTLQLIKKKVASLYYLAIAEGQKHKKTIYHLKRWLHGLNVMDLLQHLCILLQKV